MESSSEIRAFLMTRRERLQPEDVGLPRGVRRRVAGLRREEVATLAGVSVDYYVQVERGQVVGVSAEVLTAIAGALQLNAAERSHLFTLVRGVRRRRRPARPARMPVALQQLLDAIVGAPAVVQSGALDVLAANDLGRMLYRQAFAQASQQASGGPPNLARFVYLGEEAPDFYDDWDAAADDVAAMLRAEVARAPQGEAETLVEELVTASEAFAQRWAAHDVMDHRRGVKVVGDPEVGEMHLRYEALEVAGMPGVRLFGYTPDPDHPETGERLRLLSSLLPAPAPIDHLREDAP